LSAYVKANSDPKIIAMTELEGWLNTTEAAQLTGYTQAYMRMLAHKGEVDARKVGRDWLIKRKSLLAYKAQMDRLGPSKHSPWRKPG
jgi:excisionase family DNA binding protein